MKLRFTIPVVLIFIAGLSFAQQKSYEDKQMIITPDGKLLLRADGSIISQDYKKEITNQIQSFNDAPIGTPFSWDGNLGFLQLVRIIMFGQSQYRVLMFLLEEVSLMR